jgi:hypothetical protein
MKFTMRVERPGDFKPEVLDAALRDSIPRITRLVYANARVNLGGGLVGVRTGRTLGALKSRVNVAGSRPKGEVYVTGRRGHIARLLQTGVRAHEIRARGDGLMSLRVGDRVLRLRLVQHPGFPATFWLTKAGEAALPDAEKDLQLSVSRHLSAALTRRAS